MKKILIPIILLMVQTISAQTYVGAVTSIPPYYATAQQFTLVSEISTDHILNNTNAHGLVVSKLPSQIVFSVVSPAGTTNSTTYSADNSSVTVIDDDSVYVRTNDTVYTATVAKANSALVTIQYIGNSNVTPGLVYCFGTNNWVVCNASVTNSCSGLLGIAIGTNSSIGMLTRGNLVTNSLVLGATYYVAASDGVITATAPTNTGFTVRSVGWAISTNLLSVEPSTIYLEL